MPKDIEVATKELNLEEAYAVMQEICEELFEATNSAQVALTRAHARKLLIDPSEIACLGRDKAQLIATADRLLIPSPWRGKRLCKLNNELINLRAPP